ncbi:MAG: 2-oxoacid:acceptor oxidoreductase family protein [Deltaproteobacteria bacterium]|nr:2-oxoacid:acceptor oxidoreductase family protein [Deltaproteobacteria bacterium]
MASLEIRLHGRGGQGGVTCAKILAAVWAGLGKSVQTFGDYAGERSGAPVRAYTRVSDEPIDDRNKVYEPHHLLVLDPTLLGEHVLQGLRPGGTLLLNTEEPIEAFGDRFLRHRLAVVDATAIARRRKIGTRSVVIVNTTIAGAFVRAAGLPFEALEAAYRRLGFTGNLDAAREAWDAVAIREARDVDAKAPVFAPPATAPVLPLVAHVEGAPTGLRTGSWRSQTPRYVHALAPCSAFCPAGNDVIGFVQAVAEGGAQQASEVLARTTPLAGVCGRVCPAFCMEGCNRREHDGAVDVRALERWIADTAPIAPRAERASAAPRRFAIVGGGPAGLSAAFELARHGHEATVFDGERALGGVLRTGIPSYRLPRAALDREIEALLALGVKTSLGAFLDRDRVAALAREWDAVILATGLQRLRGVTERDDLPGVEQGIRFLHRVNMEGSVRVTGHVVVLGGGNTAMDCARVAVRAGASRVTVAYRRGREEMPAIRDEVAEAEQEGVVFELLRQPLGFEGDERVRGVVLAEVELGPPDASGRRSPVVTDRRSTLSCDHVLLALGQTADLRLLPEGWALREGRAFARDAPVNVFAAGDLATGDGTVAHAIGDGRRVARLAMRAVGPELAEVEELRRPDRARAVAATEIRFDHFPKSPPLGERHVPADVRVRGFDEVNLGVGDPAAAAHRCCSCGECTRCDSCLVYCPEGIIRREAGGYAIDLEYCKGCGICVTECPRAAITLKTPKEMHA